METDLATGYPGRWWHNDGDRIVCTLCPRECSLAEGDRGFCFVRQNVQHEMRLTTYGRSTGFCIDPIEKKPLNHFYPGTSVLSFGTAGCNLGCKFCQNWDISKSRKVERLSSQALPDEIVLAAKHLDCHSVAFTYNDPIIWAEYAIDTAKECRQAGIKSVAVTAGYISPEARAPFFEFIDAANVDLKAFSEEFYHRITYSHIKPVLDTLEWLHRETDVWFEITNLIIPDANDDPAELQQMCDWILQAVGDNVPVHFSAFHPDFRMLDRERTPPETLNRAREIALSAGIRHAYTGNVDDVSRQSTYCPKCQALLIERNWYALGTYGLNGNCCQQCGEQIAGHFSERPGEWGRKRQPVDMRQFRLHTLAPLQTDSQKTESDSTSGETTTEAKSMSTNAPELPTLSAEQQQSLLKTTATLLAQSAAGLATDQIGLTGIPDVPVYGTFVSLKRNGRLRSCCGTLGQLMPLSQSLQKSAHRTATDDPRFPPVAPRELPETDFEVWLLKTPEPISSRGTERVNDVEIGRHGLQVIRGNNRGLLLPGVATDNNWDATTFLNQTCVKAGLPITAWQDDATTVLRFEGSVCRQSFRDSNVQISETAKLFGGRAFAQYNQHCRRVIDALLTGGVPPYYCPDVSDETVCGVIVSAKAFAATDDVHVSKLTTKQTLPLQSTIFSLCENLAQVLRRSQRTTDEFEIGLTITWGCGLHGTLAQADIGELDPARHAIMLSAGNTTAFAFDATKSVDENFAQLQQDFGRCDATRTEVVSFETQSSRESARFSSRPRPVPGADVRPAAVAGQFYPSDTQEMATELDRMIDTSAKPTACAAAMIPHAGWKYSGRIAGEVLSGIQFPQTIIVIGPKHTRNGTDWAVAPHAQWSIPGATVDSDRELVSKLCNAINGLEPDAAAHAREHSIEVELPLLARLAPNSRVVGIVVGAASADSIDEFSTQLADVIREMDEPPLLLISSDMNHFANDSDTRRLDELALAEIDRLDADALLKTVRDNQISMCGVVPAVIVMQTLKKLGRLKSVQRCGYATSADATGDPSRVVGYAGVRFHD